MNKTYAYLLLTALFALLTYFAIRNNLPTGSWYFFACMAASSSISLTVCDNLVDKEDNSKSGEKYTQVSKRDDF